MRILMRFFCTVLTIELLLTASARAQDKGVRVTLLLYSGRPNPTYFIESKAGLDYLKGRVAKKEISLSGKAVLLSGLGYTGILVENVGRVTGLPARFRVYNGRCEVEQKGKRVYEDRGRAVEWFLLKEAVRQEAIDERMARRLNPKLRVPAKSAAK